MRLDIPARPGLGWSLTILNVAVGWSALTANAIVGTWWLVAILLIPIWIGIRAGTRMIYGYSVEI